MRRTDIDRAVPTGMLQVIVVRMSPFRVSLDGEEYEPVVSRTVAQQIGDPGFTTGDKVIAAWGEDDPGQLFVLDRV